MAGDNYKKIRNILILVLVSNWLIAFLKIIFGFWIKSSSMTSDGYHSISDGASNIIGLAAIAIAKKPQDKSHPYGHKKYETFLSILIAVILFIISFHIMHDNIGGLRNPIRPQVNIYSFIVMIFTMIINTLVMSYEYRWGRTLKSDILISDSYHTLSDVLVSFSVIAALIGAKMGYPVIDPVCSLFISLFIAYSGFRILFSTSKVLCDTAVVDTKKIEKIAKGIEGVVECHNIRTRGREDDIHIDLHILVRPNMHINQADKLSDRIEEAIKSRVKGVSDVVVHMEPKE